MKRYIRSDYVFAMSMSRKSAIDELSGQAKNLKDHMCKVAIYDDTLNCKRHWIHEIADSVYRVYDITIKPSNNKLKYKDYEKNYLWAIGDEKRDASSFLATFRINNKRTKQYPVVDLTEDMCERYLEIAKFIKDFFKTYIDRSKEELTFEEIESMFDTKFLS